MLFFHSGGIVRVIVGLKITNNEYNLEKNIKMTLNYFYLESCSAGRSVIMIDGIIFMMVYF